jgi:hypothetical protein
MFAVVMPSLLPLEHATHLRGTRSFWRMALSLSA